MGGHNSNVAARISLRRAWACSNTSYLKVTAPRVGAGKGAAAQAVILGKNVSINALVGHNCKSGRRQWRVRPAGLRLRYGHRRVANFARIAAYDALNINVDASPSSSGNAITLSYARVRASATALRRSPK